MDRKVTKRTVMTVPYNAKPFSNRGYIREALKEKGVEVDKRINSSSQSSKSCYVPRGARANEGHGLD